MSQRRELLAALALAGPVPALAQPAPSARLRGTIEAVGATGLTLRRRNGFAPPY